MIKKKKEMYIHINKKTVYKKKKKKKHTRPNLIVHPLSRSKKKKTKKKLTKIINKK